VSTWATGKDLILNEADPAQTAESIAAFYHSLGVDFDLLFLGPSDRDAAWYEMKTGKKDRWWDDSDFERFTAFIGDIVTDTGRRAVVWQVLVERWRQHYSAVRPHSSLRYRPSAPEAVLPWPSGFASLRLQAMVTLTQTVVAFLGAGHRGRSCRLHRRATATAVMEALLNRSLL